MLAVLNLLPDGLSYYDFLRDHYPIGEGKWMDMDLRAADGPMSSSSLVFSVQRRSHDEWLGVPGYNVATTDQLFVHVVQQMQAETFILFKLADDPIKIKQEQVEAGVEPEPIRFRSFSEVIDLDGDESAADKDDDDALFGESDELESKRRYERRRFALIIPKHLQRDDPEHGKKVAARHAPRESPKSDLWSNSDAGESTPKQSPMGSPICPSPRGASSPAIEDLATRFAAARGAERPPAAGHPTVFERAAAAAESETEPSASGPLSGPADARLAHDASVDAVAPGGAASNDDGSGGAAAAADDDSAVAAGFPGDKASQAASPAPCTPRRQKSLASPSSDADGGAASNDDAGGDGASDDASDGFAKASISAPIGADAHSGSLSAISTPIGADAHSGSPSARTAHDLAEVGKRVVIDHRHGVIWKVSRTHIGIAYDIGAWEGMTHQSFAELVQPETVPQDDAVVGVLQGTRNKDVLPCGFLFEPISIATSPPAGNQWQFYMGYKPAPVRSEFALPPFAFCLSSGLSIVPPSDGLLPLQASKRGPRTAEILPPPLDSTFHFLGLAIGKAQHESRRRFAVVHSEERGMTYLSLFQDDALQLSERASLDRKRACKLAHAAFSELSGQAVKTVAGRTPLSLVRTKPALADIGPVNSASESAPESAPKSAPERAPVRAPARASAPESAPESAPVSAPVLRRRANLTAKKAAGKDSGPVLCACEKIHRRQSGPARLDADLRPEAHAAAATHSGFVSVALLNRRPDPANIPFPDVGRHQALGCPQSPTLRLPRTAPARAPPLPMANDDPALSGQRPRGHTGQ